MDFEHLRATMASRSTLCSSLLAPIVQRPRTPAFHAGNTGSNPVGGARIASGACGASRKPAFSPSGENALASGELVKLPSSLRGAFRRHAGFNVWLAFGSLRRPAGGGVRIGVWSGSLLARFDAPPEADDIGDRPSYFLFPEAPRTWGLRRFACLSRLRFWARRTLLSRSAVSWS